MGKGLVEGTQEALDNAKLHTRGLDLLNAVNGIPGLLSRSYMPKDGPMGPGEFTIFYPDSDNHEGTGIRLSRGPRYRKSGVAQGAAPLHRSHPQHGRLHNCVIRVRWQLNVHCAKNQP